eukprot:776063_1
MSSRDFSKQSGVALICFLVVHVALVVGSDVHSEDYKTNDMQIPEHSLSVTENEYMLDTKAIDQISQEPEETFIELEDQQIINTLASGYSRQFLADDNTNLIDTLMGPTVGGYIKDPRYGECSTDLLLKWIYEKDVEWKSE